MTEQFTDQQLIDRGKLEIAPSGYLRTPPNASFTLVAEGARDNWLAARAAQDIGACVPSRKIPTEEIEALVAYCETILRERDKDYVKFVERMPF